MMLRRRSSDECARHGSIESARGSDIVVVVIIVVVIVVIGGGKVQRRQAATTARPKARSRFRVGQLAVAEPEADLRGQINGHDMT